MLKLDITSQFRGIYVDISISDKSGFLVPAKAVVDTGAEATYVHPDFAEQHFDAVGYWHKLPFFKGTICFDKLDDRPVTNIEFRTKEADLFWAKLKVKGQEELVVKPIDVIAGMDALLGIDFAYFQSPRGRRTYFYAWPAREFCAWADIMGAKKTRRKKR